MDPIKQSQPEQYEGPPDFVIAVGKGYLWSWPMRIVGAAVGAGIALMTSSESGFFTKKGADILRSLKIENPQGKWVVGAGGAFVGWMVGHWAGLAVGTKQAMKDSSRGREQFNRLVTERDVLSGRVEQLEIDNDKLHEKLGQYQGRYTGRIDPNAAHGSHAAAHEAKKEQVTAPEAAR